MIPRDGGWNIIPGELNNSSPQLTPRCRQTCRHLSLATRKSVGRRGWALSMLYAAESLPMLCNQPCRQFY